MASKKRSDFGKKILFGSLMFVLLALLGLAFLLLSYETKTHLHMTLGLTQGWHIFIGVGLIFLGGIVFFISLATDLMIYINKIGERYWYVFLLFDVIKWIAILVIALLIATGGFKEALDIKEMFLP